jgi:hypothetical protein
MCYDTTTARNLLRFEHCKKFGTAQLQEESFYDPTKYVFDVASSRPGIKKISIPEVVWKSPEAVAPSPPPQTRTIK